MTNESRRVEFVIFSGECAFDGTYIALLNYSSGKDIDISKWIIKQRIDGKMEILCRLPNGLRLQSGGELRIYSRQGAAAAKSITRYRNITCLAQEELVNNDVVSWGMLL